MSSGKFPWLGMTLLTAGFLALGYGIMRATVPTPEQQYQAMAPDLRQKVDALRASRLAQEKATNAQVTAQLDDPDVQKPLWADSSRK